MLAEPYGWYAPWLQGTAMAYIPALPSLQQMTERSDHLRPAYVATDVERGHSAELHTDLLEAPPREHATGDHHCIALSSGVRHTGLLVAFCSALSHFSSLSQMGPA